MNNKKIIHFEYRKLFMELYKTPDNFDNIGCITIVVFEVDEYSNFISIVGIFNFKLKSMDEEMIDFLIKEKLKKMVIFKLKYQDNIDSNFEQIIKSFNNKT